MGGVGAAELVDILVIVAHGNHSHVFIAPHQRQQQTRFVVPHILGFVNHQHAFGYLRFFHLAILYHGGGLQHYATGIVQVARTPQQVEAEGMECLDVDIVGGVAYKLHEPFLEFGGR